MNSIPNLVDGIRQVDTPLKLLAFIVVAFTITVGVVFSTGAELVQLHSIGALVLVVLASIAVVFLRANWCKIPRSRSSAQTISHSNTSKNTSS
jgi:flagellar motor component MotA